MKTKNAQGTIEYLIVIGIILVISLVVVGMLSGFTGNAEGASKLSDTITSQTGKTGTFSIKEKTMNEDGNYLLLLQGTSTDTLTITNIQINDENQNYNQTIHLGQTTGFEIDTSETCTTGQTSTAAVRITYNTVHGLVKTERYTIQIKCEAYSTSTNTTIATPTNESEEESAPVAEAIYLSSTGTGLFAADENLIVNLADDYNSELTYHYTWYKNGEIIATTMLTDGLEAYFPFDNDTLDYYSTNDDQTTYGVLDRAPIYGKVGNGVYFDGGTEDCLKINSPTFLTNQTGTISFWIQPKLFDYDSLFGIWGATSKYLKVRIATSWRLGVLENFTGLSEIQTINNAYTVNIWQHFVLTSNGVDLVFYKNGNTKLASSTYLSASSPNNGQWFGDVVSGTHALIGCGDPTSGSTQNRINAYIDEFMIFDDVLTQEEVNMLYYGGLYDGNVLSSDLLTADDEIIVGYKTNDGSGWTSDQNSASVTIT